MELLIAVGFFGLISGLVYFVLASRCAGCGGSHPAATGKYRCASPESGADAAPRRRRNNDLGAGGQFLFRRQGDAGAI